jgi:prepilin-type N-terminal cleavage/methylation domain-containing protein
MNHRNQGFTLIETVIVIGIMGILMLVSYPEVMNSLETRSLEGATRDIQMSLQVARFQAVNTKLNHRVRFTNETGKWFFIIEREVSSGTWAPMRRSIPTGISNRLVLTINLPASQSVTYDSYGVIRDFDQANNSIILQSPKLQRKRQPDLRTLVFYYGGSVQYIKSSSG